MGEAKAARRSVLVYRRRYLPISETFIVDHLDSLRRWSPTPIYEDAVAEGEGIASERHAARGVLPDRRRRLAKAALTRLGHSSQLSASRRETGARLLHAHFLTDAVRMTRFCERHRLPLIVTAHGFDATISDDEWRKTPAGRAFLRERARLAKAATLIVCVSDFIRKEIGSRGFPQHKLVTCRLGIDLGRYRPGPPAHERSGVLFAGRLVEKKDPEFLLRAWRLLPADVRAQGLVIIGDGPLRPAIEAAVRDAPEVRVLGAQPRHVVQDMMARARVFAFPSRRADSGDAEGMPIVTMEAQALGTPIMTVDAGPIREAVSDGESALIVPQGDVGGYAAAMARVLCDDALAARLGAGGPRVAAGRFDLASNTAALEDIYDQYGSRDE